jgi:uncharacterized protein (DUF1501 family)
MSEKKDQEVLAQNGFLEDQTACEEYRELSRREFISRSKMAAAGIATAALVPKIVLGDGRRRGGVTPKTFVYVFLRGGPDYLSRIVPYEDPWYYAPNYDNGIDPVFVNGLRPTIGINPPTPQPYEYAGIADRCLPLGDVNGDKFGVNEAYDDPEWSSFNDRNSLYQAYNEGDVAFVMAAGSPDKNRSHFQAEARIEYGTPNQPQLTFDGFLARYLAVAPTLGSPLRGAALSFNRLIPKCLAFAEKTQAFVATDEMVFPGNTQTIDPLLRRYEAQTEGSLKAGVLNTFDVIDLLAQVDTTPHPLAKYNGSEFGERMRNMAALIKAGINIELAYVDRTGWDNHANQRPHKGDGGMYDRLKDLAQNLAAFRIDLQQAGKWDDVVVVEQGEFGRQNNENGNFGSDHGNAGIMTVMGGSVNGGLRSKRFDGLTDGWPGLEPTELQNQGQADAMRVTIDYRWVIGEIFMKCMGVDAATLNNMIFNTQGEMPPYMYQDLGLIS